MLLIRHHYQQYQQILKRHLSSLSTNTFRPRNNFLSNSPGRTGGDGRRGRPPPPFGIPPYIWIAAGGSTIVVAYTYFAYLEEVPLTHRKRWIATNPAGEKQLGDQEYKQLLQHFRANILPDTHPASRTVERVGSRIAEAALIFGREKNLKHLTSPKLAVPFTYTVVQSDMANAFVLPGNHVFVMTGLFRFISNEDDLAAVLGHEVAHNVARHVGEKISGSVLVNILARLSLLADPTGVLFTLLLPAAALFRELPHSRTQETEADEIGVHLAAMACYDPRASKRVFAAMAKAGGDGAASQQQPPEFLSTHPSHASRVANFEQWMPDAMNIYNGDGGERCRSIRRDMDLARQYAAQQQ